MDWEQVARYLDDLYIATDGLERMFPGRRFTLDGHLVGSIREVVAAYVFDLELCPASSRGHDARSRDGRMVEIKLTQGKAIAMRHEPEHLIVLHRSKGGPIRIVFNGPGALPWAKAGNMQSNGQRRILLSRLTDMATKVSASQQLLEIRRPPV